MWTMYYLKLRDIGWRHGSVAGGGWGGFKITQPSESYTIIWSQYPWQY